MLTGRYAWVGLILLAALAFGIRQVWEHGFQSGYCMALRDEREKDINFANQRQNAWNGTWNDESGSSSSPD